MHVLKPEAINITRKKNIQNVLTNIKIIYIYLYIYIRSIPREWGRKLCTNKAPIVNEQTNQQKTSGRSQGDERKHEN